MSGDAIDRSVWTSIGISNILSKVNEKVYDAVRCRGEHVVITVGGTTLAEFSPAYDADTGADTLTVQVDGQPPVTFQNIDYPDKRRT